MRKPLVSVIIPTFNCSKTIGKCLDSIAKQTMFDYEVIIQDGCSSDSTLQIIENFKAIFSERLLIFQEVDNGIYDAMNKAIGKANGGWLYFLGSDDYLIDNDVLCNVKKFLLNPEIDFLYGNVNSPDYGQSYGGYFDYEKLKGINICHQSIFFRRQVFDKIGNFNTRYKVNADWDFNFKCFLNPEIRVQHVNLLIAFFAPSGFSKQNRDDIFMKEMWNNLSNYERKYIPFVYWKNRCIARVKRMLKL